MTTTVTTKLPNQGKLIIRDGILRRFFDRINHGPDLRLQTASMLEKGELRRTRMRALDRLGDDSQLLKLVAVNSKDEALAITAISRIKDPAVLKEIAESDGSHFVKMPVVAANKLASLVDDLIKASDTDALVIVATYSENLNAANKAVSALANDGEALAKIANRTDNFEIGPDVIDILCSNIGSRWSVEDALCSVLNKCTNADIAEYTASKLEPICTKQSSIFLVAVYGISDLRLNNARLITNRDFLVRLAKVSNDSGVKSHCADKLSSIGSCSIDEYEIIAMHSSTKEARESALGNLGSNSYHSVALKSPHIDTCILATNKLSSDDDLFPLAKNPLSFYEVKLLAVSKLGDESYLRSLVGLKYGQEFENAVQARLAKLESAKTYAKVHSEFEAKFLEALKPE